MQDIVLHWFSSYMSTCSFPSSLSIPLWGIVGLDPWVQYFLSADSSLNYWIPWVASTRTELSPWSLLSKHLLTADSGALANAIRWLSGVAELILKYWPTFGQLTCPLGSSSQTDIDCNRALHTSHCGRHLDFHVLSRSWILPLLSRLKSWHVFVSAQLDLVQFLMFLPDVSSFQYPFLILASGNTVLPVTQAPNLVIILTGI